MGVLNRCEHRGAGALPECSPLRLDLLERERLSAGARIFHALPVRRVGPDRSKASAQANMGLRSGPRFFLMAIPLSVPLLNLVNSDLGAANFTICSSQLASGPGATDVLQSATGKTNRQMILAMIAQRMSEILWSHRAFSVSGECSGACNGCHRASAPESLVLHPHRQQDHKEPSTRSGDRDDA